MKSKKLIAVALAAAIILAAPTNALAAEVSVSDNSTPIQTAAENDLSGKCGDNLTWSLDETTGTLTISGDGDMWDWDWSSYAPWSDEAKNIKSVVFNGNITSIGSGAFSSCYNLTSITIPDSVTSIGDWAFYYCDGLTSITIPDSVTSIGEEAFWSCDSLTNITIPASVTSIGYNVFECSGLKSINVDENNKNYTSIDGVLFNESLTEVIRWPIAKTIALDTLPDTVTVIGDCAFAWCFEHNCSGSTQNIVIPDSVVTIGNDAFLNEYTDTLNITIGKSVQTIGDNAFWGCGYDYLSIPSTVKTIGKKAFAVCAVNFDSNPPELYIDVPDKISYIGENAFMGSANMFGNHIKYSYDSDTKTAYITGYGDMYDNPTMGDCGYWSNMDENTETVVVSDGVTHIGAYAFEQYTNLTNVIIPDSVTSIGERAFDNLTSLIIPDSVTSIDALAFEYCDELKDIYYTGTQDDWDNIATYYISDEGSEGDIVYDEDSDFRDCLKNVTIHYNYVNETDKSNKCGENATWEYDEASKTLTVSGAGAMYDYMWYEQISDDEWDRAFRDNPMDEFENDVETIIIEEGITYIGSQAFDYTPSLKKVVVAKTVESIGEEAFRFCGGSEIYIYNPDCDIFGLNDDYDEGQTITSHTIYGYKNSTAESYAKKYDIKFVSLDSSTENEITAITLDKTSLTLKRGQKSALAVTATPSDITVSADDITWTSSNESVATVSATGEVKGIKAGKATITATTENGVSATCEVTVRIISQYYTVNVSSNYGGLVIPKFTHRVKAGDSDTIKISPYSKYKIESVTVNGEEVPVINNCVTLNDVEQDCSVYVTFTDADKYKVTVTANEGGRVSHLGTTEITSGSFMSIAVIPKIGYRIKSINKDGVSIRPSCCVFLTKINEDHTVDVEFEKITNITLQDVENAFSGLK